MKHEKEEGEKMSDKIKRAELLAGFVHLGQKRQDGEDYINHPRRIVDAYLRSLKEECDLVNRDDTPFTPEQEDIICAAWLHDTIEDYKWIKLKTSPISFIIDSTFGEKVGELVFLLTHFKEHETYNEYIESISKNPQALQIKWADMIDNTSYPIPEKQRTKYRDACIHLQKKGVVVPDILLERLHIMIIRTCESCGKSAATIQHSDDFICKECVKKYGT